MSIHDYFKREVRIRHLRAVVEIEESILLTKAAERLNVSQPALSKTLAEIEASIGEALFDRSRAGLKPTAVGAAFIRAARSVLNELDKADTDISAIANIEQRTLLVGAMPTSGMTFLSEAIKTLQTTHPDLTIRIVDGPTPALLQQLVAGRLHVVIGANMRQSIPEALEMVNLYEDRMHIVMGHDHPLCGQSHITWDDCLAYPWILPPASHTMRSAFDQRLRQLLLQAPRRVIENQSLDFVMAHMQDAHAFNLMPGRLIQKLQAPAQVKVLKIHGVEEVAIPMRVMAMVALSEVGRPDVSGLIQAIRKSLSQL
ncbi:MAG: LysR substrate-binding domain-containing protein [Limnohabitans sp.]|uniref:LysR substrate-binding domain-containing protein n=1 Tax=Limnohabitans sp. TaxID=1907725 RepID=UPI003BB1E347